MNLDEALAVYIHLHDVRYATRDRDPAWIEANKVITKYAKETIDRLHSATKETKNDVG
jgi:hypothetical protein